MRTSDIIIGKLDTIERELSRQNLLRKEILSFDEACLYLEIRPDLLHKLTCSSQIPHYCSHGTKLFFKRSELNLWLQRGQVSFSHKRITWATLLKILHQSIQSVSIALPFLMDNLAWEEKVAIIAFTIRTVLYFWNVA